MTSEAEPVEGSYCPWPQYGAYHEKPRPQWDRGRRVGAMVIGVRGFDLPDTEEEQRKKWANDIDDIGYWEVGKDGEPRWVAGALKINR